MFYTWSSKKLMKDGVKSNCLIQRSSFYCLIEYPEEWFLCKG